MKTCSKCGETKPFSEFRKDNHKKDGLRNPCKECRRKPETPYIPPTTKLCGGCGETKPLEAFHVSSQKRIGRQARCKACIKIANARYYQEKKDYFQQYYKDNSDRYKEHVKGYAKVDPLQKRRSLLKRYYNMTLEQYDELLINQEGVCAICHRRNSNENALSVDHDHSCCPGSTSCGLCVRGLLCSSCNLAIGSFNDRIDFLTSAISYLKSFQGPLSDLN